QDFRCCRISANHCNDWLPNCATDHVYAHRRAGLSPRKDSSVVREIARAGRLVFRALIGAALIVAASFVPLAQTATAKVAHKGILLESNDAAPGFDKIVDVGMSFDMVGFTWTSPTVATLQVRGLKGSTWSDWTSADGSPTDGPDATSREHKQQVGADPVWL